MKVIIDYILYIEQPPVIEDKSIASALDIRFNSDAGENRTVRDYFYNLLRALWIEEEGFSGKRPFGNSGWQHDIYNVLVKHGYVHGELEDGMYAYNFDRKKAAILIEELIRIAFYG